MKRAKADEELQVSIDEMTTSLVAAVDGGRMEALGTDELELLRECLQRWAK